METTLGTIRKSLRVPKALFKDLDKLAKKENRNWNNFCNNVFTEYRDANKDLLTTNTSIDDKVKKEVGDSEAKV